MTEPFLFHNEAQQRQHDERAVLLPSDQPVARICCTIAGPHRIMVRTNTANMKECRP
jgi:hypothetical protein